MINTFLLTFCSFSAIIDGKFTKGVFNMNGELDKLQARLQELIGEILRIKNEIFSIKKMQKNGEKLVRKDLRHL